MAEHQGHGEEGAAARAGQACGCHEAGRDRAAMPVRREGQQDGGRPHHRYGQDRHTQQEGLREVRRVETHRSTP